MTMNRSTLDVKTEVRKLAGTKPVQAAAGAGVLASEALRELPARITRWRSDGSLAALPARATEYMTTARTKAVQEYDKLAQARRPGAQREDRPARQGPGREELTIRGPAAPGRAGDGLWSRFPPGPDSLMSCC